jgi:hypothetical protein
VADPRMAELMAGVFASRGNYGLVVHGGDGLDELTTTTSSTVWVYADGSVVQRELDPLKLGVPKATISDLVGGDAVANAQVVRDVVAGQARSDPGRGRAQRRCRPWSRTASPPPPGWRTTSPTSSNERGRRLTPVPRSPSCRSGSRSPNLFGDAGHFSPLNSFAPPLQGVSLPRD